MGLVRRAVGCAVAALALAVLLLVVGIVGYRARAAWLPRVGEALNVTPDLRRADVIIVLGGGTSDRDVYASQLYRRGLAPHVIATGSPTGTETGATGLVERGVPRDAIVLANGSQNTHEDAKLSRQLMAQHTWRSALLVTDPYHIRRSVWTFRSEFSDAGFEVWPAPVEGGSFNPRAWWKTEDGFVEVNDEYLKLVYYLAHGYIAPSVILQGT